MNLARPVTASQIWRQRLLIAIVLGYVGVLILAPIAQLIYGAFAQGIAPIWAALREPEVLQAFQLTLLIGLIAVVVHAFFGTLVAWVLVRHRFPGRKLLNGLIDMPFAISAVVVGYMLLLIFGRNGLLAPLLAALNLKVAFAVPGMIAALYGARTDPSSGSLWCATGAGGGDTGCERLADVSLCHLSSHSLGLCLRAHPHLCPCIGRVWRGADHWWWHPGAHRNCHTFYLPRT